MKKNMTMLIVIITLIQIGSLVAQVENQFIQYHYAFKTEIPINEYPNEIEDPGNCTERSPNPLFFSLTNIDEFTKFKEIYEKMIFLCKPSKETKRDYLKIYDVINEKDLNNFEFLILLGKPANHITGKTGYYETKTSSFSLKMSNWEMINDYFTWNVSLIKINKVYPIKSFFLQLTDQPDRLRLDIYTYLRNRWVDGKNSKNN